MATRIRMDKSVPVNDELGRHIYIYDGQTLTNTPYYSGLHSLTNKHCVDELHPHHPYEGGPFDLRKSSVSYRDAYGFSGTKCTVNPTSLNGYDGNFRYYRALGALPASTSAIALSHGPTAWNKYKPGKPIVSGAVFIAELREMGVSSIKRQLKDFVRLWYANPRQFSRYGRNYLAYQFGWKPFVSDLRKWIESIKKIDSQMARLRRNNGVWSRKGGTLFENTSTVSSTTASGTIQPQPAYMRNVKVTNVTTDTEKCWFQGCFRYYIPELDDPKWGKFKAARQLWDLELGPEQVYNLIPFSWLANWFVDLGSVISNLQSQVYDQLAAKYAYVMLHRRTRMETSVSLDLGTYLKDSAAGYKLVYKQINLGCTTETETKTRVAASPFGFNLSLPDMDAWRLSILSALGVSKLRL